MSVTVAKSNVIYYLAFVSINSIIFVNQNFQRFKFICNLYKADNEKYVYAK